MPPNTFDDNIDPSNGSVSSSNKPSPEPMLTQTAMTQTQQHVWLGTLCDCVMGNNQYFVSWLRQCGFIYSLAIVYTWWRHQMEIFSVLLTICAGNSSVRDDFPAQRPVTQSLDVFFDLNKRLGKQWWGWWFETPWRSLWRHCNVMTAFGFQGQLTRNPSMWFELQRLWNLKCCCNRPSPTHDAVIRVHCTDTVMSAMASYITGVSIICSTVCLGAVQRKHQSPASLAFFI